MSPEEKINAGRRIAFALKEAKKTQAQLAAHLGLAAQSVISNWVNGQLESWLDYLPQLSEFLGRPPSYFLGLSPERGDDQRPVSDEIPVIDQSGLPELIPVPEYDVRLSAGGGFIVHEDTIRRYWTLPRWLIIDSLGLNPSAITIQEVVGDSMSPTLESGDYVLIDLTDRRIGLPGIFAVWDGDALVCKRLERIPATDPDEIRMKSDNPLHGEYRVLAERVNVVGRVRWFTRRM